MTTIRIISEPHIHYEVVVDICSCCNAERETLGGATIKAEMDDGTNEHFWVCQACFIVNGD